MPERTRRAPSYRKHKASGQAVVKIGEQVHYLGRWGTPESRAEYDRLIAEWRQAGRLRPPTPGTSISVAELLVGFLRYAQDYYRRGEKPTSPAPRFTPSREAGEFSPSASGSAQLGGDSVVAYLQVFAYLAAEPDRNLAVGCEFRYPKDAFHPRPLLCSAE